MATSKTNNGRTRANAAKAAARSAGAKLPADHQTAENDVVDDIVEFEYDGDTYEVDTDKFDDLEIMDTLNRSISLGLRRLLGADEYNRLVENFKANDAKGILRMSKVQDFITRMQESVGPLV